MIRTLPLFLALLFWAGSLLAQTFEVPALTGRVVDQAELLDTQTEARLTGMLAAHEQASGEQVVVVTLPDLQGRSIEEVGLQLGREWGIGQKEEDSGALLIIARDGRKIRIEVGYGLEGRLTDAQSSVIISSIIAPAFQQGDFARGITDGTAAIIRVLGGDPLQTAGMQPAMPMGGQEPGGLGILGFFLMLVAIFVIGGGRGGRGGGRGAGRALLVVSAAAVAVSAAGVLPVAGDPTDRAANPSDSRTGSHGGLASSHRVLEPISAAQRESSSVMNRQ